MELTPEQWERVKALFETILDKPAVERSALLATASEDLAVLEEVGRLLRSHAEAGHFLSIPPQPSPVFLHLTTEARSFSPGDLLANRFRITRFLARGGMGEVYEAEDVELREQVALKTIRSEFLEDTHALERFKREVHLAKQVTHPNVCRIFDLFRHATSVSTSILLVSMELLHGETLAAYLERVRRMTWREASPLALQMANGLGAAHEMGILHRDFKPGNVVLIQGAKGIRAVITDFGLALQPGHDATRTTLQTGTGHFGTPAYMSPEQVEGRSLTPASDVYSLGLVLYEMVTGTRPFDDPTPLSMAVRRLHETPASPRTLVPELDARGDQLISRCIERVPMHRFVTAEEVAKAIQEGGVRLSWAHGRRVVTWAVGVLGLLLVGLGGGLYYRSRQGKPLTAKDTIVLTDFTNTTGDPVFDDTLKTALTLSLQQSPFLNVLSDGKVQRTLKLMTRPADTKLTPEVAGELCQRAGSKAYIAGSIANLGSQYVLGLKAVNCQSGDTLAQEQFTAASKEKVLDALGEAASKLRGELGESLATVQKLDVPLSEATTPSLDALRAYSLGNKALQEKGDAAALPYHQRAIQLDPNFAAGYEEVGDDYFGMSESGRASEYFTKAFQLREHTTEREKLAIAGNYYWGVTGELDKAAQTFQEAIQNYPRASGLQLGLGNAYVFQGQYEKASEAYRQSLHLAPDNVSPYANLTTTLLGLQHLEGARQTIQQAQERKLDDYLLHNALYALAFLDADFPAMADQEQWFAGKPEENFGFALASDTEAYAGHLHKARELTQKSVDSAIRTDSKENGAIWLENAALREAAFGNPTEAKQAVAEGLKLVPTSQGVEVEAALAYAMASDTGRAESLTQELNKRYPLDTQMQSLWLPAIKAQLLLNRKNPVLAINTLQAASPVELGLIPFVANLSCLYPTYVRGQAYLAAGQGSAAASEFQKILDHSGIVWNCWTGALAHLGDARANALQARTSQGADADAARVRALAAYKDFLTLWKDADPDIPILKQAKAEYEKLQ